MNSSAITRFVLVGFGAGLLVLSSCQRKPAEPMNGIYLNAQDGKLMIRGPGGGDVRTFPLAPDAEVTINGTAAELKDLNSGQPVKVLFKNNGGNLTATRVAARTEKTPKSPRKLPDDPMMSEWPERRQRPEQSRVETVPGGISKKQNEQDKQDDAKDGEKNVQEFEEAKESNVTDFEGIILEINGKGFLLRLENEERFVHIPKDARVAVLDDRRKQKGQIATVIAEKVKNEYFARTIIVRPQ